MSLPATIRLAPDGERFSPRRFLTVMIGDLLYHARRPLFLIWIFIVILSSWGMSTGSMQIRSGDTAVGGTKAWITSEFAVAMQLAVLTMLCYAFFLAIAAGLTMIQDEEWRLNELLHSTPLTPGEYVWAKFAAVLVCALGVLAIHLAAMIFFFHVLPNSEANEIHGPLQVRNYLRPALIFSAPTIVFLAGTSLAVGEWTQARDPGLPASPGNLARRSLFPLDVVALVA